LVVRTAVFLIILLSGAVVAQTGSAGTPPSTSSPASATSSSRRRSATTTVPKIDPDEGSVTGNTYRSRYFGFAYTFPEGLQIDENFMQGEQDESKRAFILLAAYGSAERDSRKGIVISADRNLDPTIKTAADYLSKMTREHFQPDGFEVIKGARELSLASRSFQRVDYRKGTIYQSAVATLWRGYVLVFYLAAPTQPEIEGLVATLATLDFAPGPRPEKASRN
jgi:hypothetical protein